jgi:uncharacterized SAM-binding protein YcdF (DUF218 family)
MYFILSKVLYYLIIPVYWIVGLTVAGFWVKNKKRKRILWITAGVLFYLLSIPFVFERIGRLWDISSRPPASQKYSCAIVLGGFSSAGGPDVGHFTMAADRFIQGVKLFNIKQTGHILISGGNGTLTPGEFREAAWVRTQLKAFNVPDSCMLIEKESKNTSENARFSKVLLNKAGLKPPYLLVTSAFHMRRSLMIYKKAGMHVVAYPSNFLIGDGRVTFDKFLPSAEILSHWGYYVKEVIGYAVNYFH